MEQDAANQLFGRRVLDVTTNMNYVVLSRCGPGYLVMPEGYPTSPPVYYLPDVAIRFEGGQ